MTADWVAWSRESVALFQAGNRDWQSRVGLWTQPYRFTFLWSWANESLPPLATALTARVRAFGEDNDLPLLTRPE